MKKKFSCLLCLLLAIALFGCGTAVSKYDDIDREQSKEEHIEQISKSINDFLNSNSIYISSEDISWIGFSHYKDTTSEEDFDAMQLGGYYSYDATSLSGQVISGRVSCYWKENEEPVIVDMKVMVDESKENNIVLVEYSDEKMEDCWNKYQSHVSK